MIGRMARRLKLDISPQPNFQTCGVTCLQAVYGFYGQKVELDTLISEVSHLDTGGTLAVLLACDALRRGFDACIFTYNLQIFDPSWFDPGVDLAERLRLQAEAKPDPKLRTATEGYLEFLRLGGRVRCEELNSGLIRRYLKRGHPLLTGLSATWLYRTQREYGPTDAFDDIRGHPTGHFVVLCGYDQDNREVNVADPLLPNPITNSQYYSVEIDRLIASILLGIVTYDANLLLIEPRA